MRPSSNKSAHRHLSSRKRSIVAMVAGLAMVLGTTSVGASIFGADDTVLQRERAASSTLQDSASTSEDLDSDQANPMNGQAVLGDPNPKPTTPSATRKTESAGTAASSAVVEQIVNPPAGTTTPETPSTTPTDPDTTPAAPTDPDADTNPNPTDPIPGDDGDVLGDSIVDPDAGGVVQ